MVSVSIIIATYGIPAWAALAVEHALPSALDQGCQVIVEHGETLAGARNHGAAQAGGDWLVFLDADDQLEPGYVDSILDGSGDLRVSPLVEVDGGARRRIDLSVRDIECLNPCHVGTAIRRDMFDACGGFPDFPAWEDWALFLRAHRRGATIEHLPADRPAYVATIRPDRRNTNHDADHRLHRRIRVWA